MAPFSGRRRPARETSWVPGFRHLAYVAVSGGPMAHCRYSCNPWESACDGFHDWLGLLLLADRYIHETHRSLTGDRSILVWRHCSTSVPPENLLPHGQGMPGCAHVAPYRQNTFWVLFGARKKFIWCHFLIWLPTGNR